MKKSPVEQLLDHNLNQPDRKTARLFHGSDREFDVFTTTGRRLPSLDYGHYLTPSLDKALLYGPVVMQFECCANILDWNNLTTIARQAIEQLLLESMPDDRIAGFSENETKFFPFGEEDAVDLFFETKQAETAHYWHDRAKARMDAADNGYIISWSEGGNLRGANNHQLLALAQEYYHGIARHLGFEGAKFGDEVVIYDSSLLRKISTLTSEDIKHQTSNVSLLDGGSSALKCRCGMG